MGSYSSQPHTAPSPIGRPHRGSSEDLAMAKADPVLETSLPNELNAPTQPPSFRTTPQRPPLPPDPPPHPPPGPQDNFGYDLPAVEAAMKKHEAIEADVSSYRERIQAVAELALEVEAENYYDAKRVAAQRDNVLRQWGLLNQLLRARRARLEQHLALQRVFQEMVYMIDWMEEMQVPGGRPHFGIRGASMGYGGSRWDTGGPNGVRGVPVGDEGSQWEMNGPSGR